LPAGPAQSLPAAPANVNPPSKTAALGTVDGEEESDGDAREPVERAAVAAARAAIAHGMKGLYEELDSCHNR